MTECLITLRIACGAGTDQFDSEKYLRERDAFASTIMCWRSHKTIDIYDQSRDGEGILTVLGTYQQGLAQRRYVPDHPTMMHKHDTQEEPKMQEDNAVAPLEAAETIWLHDAETLAWIKKKQQQQAHQSEQR